MDIQENEIDQGVFSKELLYFESESFVTKVNEIFSKSEANTIKDSLQYLFGNIKINFINQNLIFSFVNFLKKIQKENLPNFLTQLVELNLSSKLLTNIIAEGLLSFLHSRYENDQFLKTSVNFFLEKINLKTFRKTEKLANIFLNALANPKSKIFTQKILFDFHSNYSKNLNYYILLGNLFKSKNFEEGEFKTNLQNLFTNYYCEYILSDDDRENNLSKQRTLTPFVKYLPNEFFFQRILPDIEALLLRSSNNFKFLENFFIFYENKFDKEFSSEFFTRFYTYFFTDKTFESAKLSFKKIVNYLDKKTLLDKLLSFSFMADKNDLNLNLSLYLSNLIYSDENSNIENNSTLLFEDLVRIFTFILKKLEMQNENNKFLFENILENLVKGILIFSSNLDVKNKKILFENRKREKNSLAKNIQEDFTKQTKKLLSSPTYSFFYQHIYMILTELVKKTNIELDKTFLDLIFNQMNLITNITLSNYKNGLALYSLGFAISSFLENSANLLNTYKKNITQAMNCIVNPESFILLTTNTFSENSFESINLFNILNSFASKFSENKNLRELFSSELKDFLKIISVISFYKSNKLYEKVLYRKIISEIKEKNYFNVLINSTFVYIMNNYSLEPDNQNNDFIYQKNYEKFSFNKLTVLLEYFSVFINEFNDKDYLKFLVLSNLNTLNNNTKNNDSKNNTSIYKNKLYNKLKNIIDIDENNLSLGKEIENKLLNYIKENYKILAIFIFSDIGLFNSLNLTVKNSCLNLIKFIVDKKLNETLTCLIKYCFEFLNLEKLKFIDEVAEYYRKQMDYISFYDLENIVESLKNVEKNYKNSISLNLVPEKKVVIPTTQNLPHQKGGKGKNPNVPAKTGLPAKDHKKHGQEVKIEKVDKDTQLAEYKNFIDNFIVRISKNFDNNLKRIFEIVNILNKNLELNKDKESSDNHKLNLIFSIKNIWKILSVKFISDNIKDSFISLFRSNNYSKDFFNEFTYLMYAEANPHNLNDVLDLYPNILENFNEKLNLLLNPLQNPHNVENKKIKIFEYFDFIIIRILFFSILAHEIPNDHKSNSVDNLINIIETLNKDILNFEDISTLAVGLLKTSYNSENLSNLLEIFMKRCSQENFLTLCNDILEYEYFAKLSFLEQIFHLNFSYLRNYKNLVYKIWVLIFDENDNISHLATKIWNKFNLYLDVDYGRSKEFNMAFTNHHLVDSMNSANRAYAFIMPSQIGFLLKEYQNFYENDLSTGPNEDQDDDRHKSKRIILFDFVDETIELFSEELKKDLLEFLTRISDKEHDQKIFPFMNKSIFNIIKSITNEKILQNIIESSESNIRAMTSKNNKDINLKYLKIVLMILNSILMKDNILKNKQIKTTTIDNLYESIYELSLKVENYDILLLIGISFLYLSKENREKSKNLLNKILEEFKTENKKVFNNGKCFILASLVKFFGIHSFKDNKIYDAILENMKKPKSIIEKQNSMLLIKVLSFSLKKLFEPYLVILFDQICELITDREETVRNFTQLAVKSFMKELSGYGVKSIMPRLIKDLHSMNWRSKVVNIELLGQFAFCAPKQLSVYIPKVIKEIMIVFKDPHHKVQETAVNVLKDISSVIRNPEIVDLSSLLIDAIANPPEKSKDALTALLETDFKHAIDPPSLALIIPIIDYNLKVDNEQLKKMAAHVIGSIANLIIDPIHIFHYLDIIMPNLKIALFDGIPECRNAMSKAIGSLAKSLGTDYLMEILVWLDKYLAFQSETVQKSGAAQAYAEILVAMGDNFIDKTLPDIISKIQENDYIAKEGYLSIFVFLPGCMGEKFEKYFDLIFPLIIEAFSDDHENVRNVSNKIFEICIRLFAKRNTKQLLDPLLTRLFESNWRIRNSSIALIKTLIANLNKEFFKESSVSFPKELRDQVLTFTFILKADTCGNTGTIANMIWRDYVDNIPKYLNRILKNIYEQIVELLTINNDDTLDIAEGIIKMMVTKFSDKFFYELIPIMKENIQEKKDSENIVYATFYIIQLACSEAGEKLLGGFKEKMLKIVNENICTPHHSVRKLIASVVYEISNKFHDNSINKNFIHHIMKLARNKPIDEQNNLLEIVADLIEISEGEVLNIAMGEMFKKPYEQGFIILADSISDTIAESLSDPTEFKDLYNRFMDVLPVLPEITIKSVISVTIKIGEENLLFFVEFLDKCKSKIESGSTEFSKNNIQSCTYFVEMIYMFLEKTTQDISKINVRLLEMLVSMLIYDDVNLIQILGKSIKYIVEKSNKSDLDKLLENFMEFLVKVEDKLEMEKINKNVHLTKNFKIMMDSLLFFVQHSLLYADNKILASDYVQIVIDYSTREIIKPYIMKFNGPLIRILSEKLNPLIKEKILDNIKSIIIKSKDDIKGISPQLQSVFIKTLSDTSFENSERAQLKAGENILRLLQYYPRTDVITNDIMKSIISKCEKGEGLFCLIEIEILADIIRFYGNVLKQTVIDDHYAKIMKLINTSMEIPYDILVILLSAYTRLAKDTQETEKMIENTAITQELPRKLFNFVTIFNGNLNYFNTHKKNALKLIKPLPKDQSVIMLKNLGKVINKYTYFIDFDKENITKILESYCVIIEQIVMETDILTPSNPMVDANLCVFILSLGYLENYSENFEFLKKVLEFIIKLVETSKVNSQLLVNCLSLLTLHEIKPNVDHIEISNSLIELNIDADEVEKIENFLKKVYYFKDK